MRARLITGTHAQEFIGVQIVRRPSAEHMRKPTTLRHVIKMTIEKGADRLGYAVIPIWRLERLELATHLRKVFDQLHIDCVFDVGANVGNYGVFLREEVGYKGLIISAEPVHEYYQRAKLLANADGNWIVHNLALGSHSGRLLINVTKNIAFSSFLTPDTRHVPEMADRSVVTRTEEVDVVRFNEFLHGVRAGRSIGNIYLKLDTQGYDLEVIKGAGAAVADVRALQSEISVLPLYAEAPDYITAIRTLSDLGFHISGLFPVNRDAQLRVIEFDCVMVRPAPEVSR
jgi:FkbM family methyltransferase